MAEQYDPLDYYQPGKLRLDDEALESAQNSGIDLAALLADGDTTPLPDAVDKFLIRHAFGINNRSTGEARVEIAQQLQTPPFTSEDARLIGRMIGDLVVVSQEAATKLSFGDIMGAAIFSTDMTEPNHQNPKPETPPEA